METTESEVQNVCPASKAAIIRGVIEAINSLYREQQQRVWVSWDGAVHSHNEAGAYGRGFWGYVYTAESCIWGYGGAFPERVKAFQKYMEAIPDLDGVLKFLGTDRAYRWA
jgi:hypothetical protein